MSTTVRAKFTVTSLIPYYGGTGVGLSAVYSPDPNHENKAFSDATPSGRIDIVIAPGKPALEAFEMGKQFFVDFTPAGESQAGSKPVVGTAVGLSFGDALAVLKAGGRVAREGWNGKGMFLVLVPGSKALTVEEGRPLAKAGVPVGTKFNYLPHIDMYTAQGDFVPWLCSQTDALAEDWMALDVEVPAA